MEKKTFITENKNLTITLEEKESEVWLVWEGKCTLLYPTSFLQPIFEESLGFKKKIILDFLNLDYITSSSFAPIIKLLNEVKVSESSIEIRYDKRSDWQEHNFSALSLFCTPDQRIQVIGIDPF